MLKNIKTFAADETGAVTVDWVVLTAALVGLGLAVMTVVGQGVQSVSTDIKSVLDCDMTSATDSFVPNQC